MKKNQQTREIELQRWNVELLICGTLFCATGLLFAPRAALLALVLLFTANYFISRRQLNHLEKTMVHFQKVMGELDTFEGKAGAQDNYHVLSNLDDMLDRMKQFMDSQQTEQILRTQAEIHSLQSQINPHFLYNTLDTIRQQAIRAGADEVAEMTEALSLQFRYSISRPGKLSTFAEEMENVSSYLLIQNYRFDGKYHMIPFYDKNDPILMNCSMPVMTLQPIIENAIHHGLETKRGPGVIKVRCEVRRTRVFIVISDDGMGISQERLTQLRTCMENRATIKGDRGSGIALLNVDQRIKFYFGTEYGLSLFSKEGQGTQVLLTLPAVMGEQLTDRLRAGGDGK